MMVVRTMGPRVSELGTLTICISVIEHKVKFRELNTYELCHIFASESLNCKQATFQAAKNTMLAVQVIKPLGEILKM